MAVEFLNEDNLRTDFDDTTGYLTVEYRGVITPDTTADAYAWGIAFAQEIGVQNIRGMITNFSAVTKFDHKNLRTASKESRALNTQMDLSHIPVALVVTNMYQEQLVNVSMKMSLQEKRMQLVYSIDEAIKFFETWHGQKKPSDP